MAHDLAVSLKDITVGDLFLGDNSTWLLLSIEVTTVATNANISVTYANTLNLTTNKRVKWPWHPSRPMYFRAHYKINA